MIFTPRNITKQSVPENVGGVEGITLVSDAVGLPASTRLSRGGDEQTRLRTPLYEGEYHVE